MRNWSTLLVAALGIVMVGCGGSDGGGGGKDPDDGGGGGGSTSIVLPPNSSIDVSFVPGAGRAAGDMWLNFRRVFFEDDVSPQPVWTGDQSVQINAYTTPPTINVGVEMPPGIDIRRFNSFTLNPESLSIETQGGGRVTFQQAQIGGIPFEFENEADIRTLRGRKTGLQIFLDPTMFIVDDMEAPSQVQFDPARFRAVNIPNDTDRNKIQGFLSDYVSFDISALPESQKPRFRDGSVANRVFFSGDGYALGRSPGSANKYQALTLNTFVPIDGRFSNPSVDPSGRPFPGTYSLLTNDPSQPNSENAKLISLVGIWYEHSQVVRNMATTQMIAFPRSREDRIQDVVLIKQQKESSADGTDRYRITSLQWGYIEYDLAGTSTIKLFNIRDIPNGVGLPPVVTGTVTNPKDVSGGTAGTVHDVRTATYNLPEGGTGTLVVFRI